MLSNIQIVVVLVLVVCLFACIAACALDVQDYKTEFPNGDPNVGAELPSDAWVEECSE